MNIPSHWWSGLATWLWHFFTKPSAQQGQSQNVVNYGNNCTFNIIQAPPAPQKKSGVTYHHTAAPSRTPLFKGNFLVRQLFTQLID